MACVIVFLASAMKQHEGSTRNAVLICLIIIIGSYISSISLINASFECVWSPETAEEVSQYIKLNSDKGDVVLSGAMIWALESNTKPFMNITHPLAFLRTMTEDQIKEVEYRMEHEKPKFIILDGYTEKTYLRHAIKIYDVMNESYILKKEVYGSNYPIKIYELK